MIGTHYRFRCHAVVVVVVVAEVQVLCGRMVE
jgi:hypothetical protein